MWGPISQQFSMWSYAVYQLIWEKNLLEQVKKLLTQRTFYRIRTSAGAVSSTESFPATFSIIITVAISDKTRSTFIFWLTCSRFKSLSHNFPAFRLSPDGFNFVDLYLIRSSFQRKLLKPLHAVKNVLIHLSISTHHKLQSFPLLQHRHAWVFFLSPFQLHLVMVSLDTRDRNRHSVLLQRSILFIRCFNWQFSANNAISSVLV